ncbi:SUKH-4 family immunity protein [Streptomyces canus]|uniref:SUKH-4 family immunity protein n=1 Tax=Streptomyces canus TaxID=58343 RepID=UPI00324F2D3D
MVTFAQAQERAEEWINGDVPSYQHREVRVREFDLGFVVWAEDRAEGPRSDGGAQRLVIARDSGEATLWPSLPVGEVIRRYEETYGREDGVEDAGGAPAASRVDLNQTSFLLTPPEWLQDAADKLGIGGEGAGVSSGARDGGSDGAGAGSSAGSGAGSGAAPGVPAGARPWTGTDTNGGEDLSVALPETVFSAPVSGGGGGGSGSGTEEEGASSALEGSEVVEVSEGVDVQEVSEVSEVSEISDVSDSRTARISGGARASSGVREEEGARGAMPPGASSYGYPQGAGASGAGGPGAGVTPPPPSAPDASSYGYPQAAGASGAGAPPPPPSVSSYGYPQAAGASGAGAPPPPPGASSYGYPQAPGGGAGAPQPPGVPGAPGAPGPAPSAGDIADVATSKLAPPSRGAQAGGPTPPPPPGPPGVPGAQPGSGYVPTQFVSAPGVEGPSGSGAPQPTGAPSAPGGAPTPPPPGAPGMPNSSGGPGFPGVPGGSGAPQSPGAPGAPSAPGAPQPPGAPGVPRAAPGAVHHAETVLSSPPAGGPGMPPPPQAPGSPGAPRSPGSFSASGAPGAPGVPATTPGAPQPMPPGTMPPPPPGAVPSPGPVPPPGQPVPGQSLSGQPMPGQSVSGQSAPGQAVPGQAVPGQSLSGQPMPGQPVPGQSAPGQPVPGQSLSGQSAPGQPAPGQAVPGQSLSGQPMSGQSVPGQPAPAQSSPGQPVPGQPAPAQSSPGQPPAYGYPQQAQQPTVGPGYQAVLRYRAQDGSEQQLIRRSAPGTPHPEWQIFHELRGMNVPPDQVLELHTELESCELPGAYCARMIREQWPQARIASIAPYGTDHASRQQGMQQLLAHQGELHQVADGPARPAPVRAPLPPVQAAPPIPPEGVAQELAGAFGPGIFRFEQAAVSRQGVPPVVAHSLVVAGLPLDMGPFFWAQAQPGRPVPTLAELAAERGVQPASDAGSYLVMGSDFGKAICVQYGTANIVAVPVEAGPGGAPVPPQFVNTGLPEFQRCLALLGRMWRLRFGLNQEQAGRWTVDFQAQLASLDPAALGSPESWWSVLLEQMWDGLL